jgi:hypothetical protein
VLEPSLSFIGSSILRNSGYHCDGVLLACDERIPGSEVDTVLIDCMHHGNGCFSVPNLPYRPGALTQALLQLLLDKVRARKAAGAAAAVSSSPPAAAATPATVSNPDSIAHTQ